MTRYFLKFCFILLIILSGSYLIHYLVLEKVNYQYDSSLLLISYFTNYLLAALIFLIIDKVRHKHLSIIGYVFLGGSLFKFIIYFSIIRPLLKGGHELEKPVFFFFFLPYLICLVIEVLFLIKLLNQKQEQ